MVAATDALHAVDAIAVDVVGDTALLAAGAVFVQSAATMLLLALSLSPSLSLPDGPSISAVAADSDSPVRAALRPPPTFGRS